MWFSITVNSRENLENERDNLSAQWKVLALQWIIMNDLSNALLASDYDEAAKSWFLALEWKTIEWKTPKEDTVPKVCIYLPEETNLIKKELYFTFYDMNSKREGDREKEIYTSPKISLSELRERYMSEINNYLGTGKTILGK